MSKAEEPEEKPEPDSESGHRMTFSQEAIRWSVVANRLAWAHSKLNPSGLDAGAVGVDKAQGAIADAIQDIARTVRTLSKKQRDSVVEG